MPNLSGLSVEALEFLAYLNEQPDHIQQLALDMVTDALEMFKEGYSESEILHYLKRNYGKR